MWPSLTSIAWFPVIAGILIGLCQIPSVLLLGNHLGASSCYVTSVVNMLECVDTAITAKVPYFGDFKTFKDYGQLGTVIGIALGSYLSTWMSGAIPTVAMDIYRTAPVYYFIGGFMVITGARLAGGCPSGHGLSGMAKLSMASVITVASMFAGGISTAMLLF
jgi:uncharacterized membrane protein YedE/YeeE